MNCKFANRNRRPRGKAGALAARMVLCSLALALLCTGRAEAKWVWNKESGWVETNALPRDTAQQRYDYAVSLVTEEMYESALVELHRLIKEFPGTEIVEKSEVHCIACYYGMGKEWDAYKHAETFLASHPQSSLTQDVLKLEFRAGARLLERDKKSGVQVLESVVQHQPDGPLAADSFFEMGGYYQRQERYEQAEGNYGSVVEKFPDSTLASRALFAASVCALLRSGQSSKARVAALGQARSNLEYYKEHYGKTPGAKDVSEYMKIADGLEKSTGRYERRFYYALLDFLQQKYARAKKDFARCAWKLRNTDLGGDARYYVAECIFHLGKYRDSFKAFERLFDKYPGHEKLSDAGKRQFEICNILKKEEDLSWAAWAYGQVVKRSPYASFSDDAQMEEGNCYLALTKYDPARTAYEALLKAYPDSEWYGAAVFQVGKCNLEESKEVNEGASLRLKAEERFDDYITRYPTGIKVPEARLCLKEIKELKAQETFKVAEFYLRIKNPAAALVYFDIIGRDFSDTTCAPRAEEKARQIRG